VKLCLWTAGLMFNAQAIYKYEEPRWNDTDRRNGRTSRKICTSVTLSTTNTTWTRARTQASAVRFQQLIAWAMARPRPGLPNLWHACPKRQTRFSCHAAFTDVTVFPRPTACLLFVCIWVCVCVCVCVRARARAKNYCQIMLQVNSFFAQSRSGKKLLAA
jgi:hypothetical protein